MTHLTGKIKGDMQLPCIFCCAELRPECGFEEGRGELDVSEYTKL